MSKLIIVIPCYNEENRLPADDLRDFFGHGDYGCLLVNDGSTDGTATLIEELADSTDSINVLHLAENSGKAEAVRQGIQKSLELAPEYVGYWDADMATPLSEIDSFMACFEFASYEAVIGSRLARLGAGVKRRNSRHYLGRVFATVVSILLKLQVYDTQCGAKIFRSELARLIFDRPFKSKWLFDVEIFKRITEQRGLQATQDEIIYELPVMSWREVEGSKLKLSTMLMTPFQLLKIFFFR
jgi:glycosyltransferase involved in cell wall biosynthesis